MKGVTIGERIRVKREEKNLSQGELAELIGVSQMMVSYYERDFKPLSFEMAIRIAKAVETTLDYLAGI